MKIPRSVCSLYVLYDLEQLYVFQSEKQELHNSEGPPPTHAKLKCARLPLAINVTSKEKKHKVWKRNQKDCSDKSVDRKIPKVDPPIIEATDVEVEHDLDISNFINTKARGARK